jgi:hypothetical protein
VRTISPCNRNGRAPPIARTSRRAALLADHAIPAPDP